MLATTGAFHLLNYFTFSLTCLLVFDHRCRLKNTHPNCVALRVIFLDFAGLFGSALVSLWFADLNM